MAPDLALFRLVRRVIVDRIVLRLFSLLRMISTTSSCGHGTGQGGLTLGPDAVTNHINLVNMPGEAEA